LSTYPPGVGIYEIEQSSSESSPLINLGSSNITGEYPDKLRGNGTYIQPCFIVFSNKSEFFQASRCLTVLYTFFKEVPIENLVSSESSLYLVGNIKHHKHS